MDSTSCDSRRLGAATLYSLPQPAGLPLSAIAPCLGGWVVVEERKVVVITAIFTFEFGLHRRVRTRCHITGVLAFVAVGVRRMTWMLTE